MRMGSRPDPYCHCSSRRARRSVRAELFRSVSGFGDARSEAFQHGHDRVAGGAHTSSQAEARAALALRGRPQLRAASQEPERPLSHTRGNAHRVRKHSRDEHRRPARTLARRGQHRDAQWQARVGARQERRHPLPSRRLLPARGPVRPAPRAAQGRATDPPVSVAIAVRSETPTAASRHDKLRGGNYGRTTAVAPARTPTSRRFRRLQASPDCYPRHGSPGTIGSAALPDASLRVSTSNPGWRRVPIAPVFIKTEFLNRFRRVSVGYALGAPRRARTQG